VAKQRGFLVVVLLSVCWWPGRNPKNCHLLRLQGASVMSKGDLDPYPATGKPGGTSSDSNVF